jgi:hypothetical protein
VTQATGLPRGVKVIVGFHVFNLLIWSIGQTGALISYDTVAAWGLQDPRALVDPVIVQVSEGVALADTIIMLPLFLVAAIGLVRKSSYGVVASWLVFGITLYWPVVFWSSQSFYARGNTQHVPTSPGTVILPAALMLIAGWASWYLWRNRAMFR